MAIPVGGVSRVSGQTAGLRAALSGHPGWRRCCVRWLGWLLALWNSRRVRWRQQHCSEGRFARGSESRASDPLATPRGIPAAHRTAPSLVPNTGDSAAKWRPKGATPGRWFQRSSPSSTGVHGSLP